MPGGKGNIRPEDNPKPFVKGHKYNEKWTEKKALELGNELIEWLNEVDENGNDKGNILFNEFLYLKNNLHPSLISKLKKKFSTFAKLLEHAKKIQETKIVKYGLAERLNVNMAKFVLSAKHNYTEKQEIKQTGNEILKIEITKEDKEELDKLLNEDD